MNFLRSLLFVAAAAVFATSPALAHHVMGGEVPSTFMAGLLSGFGHPIIGIDHFAFVVLVGVAAAFSTHPFLMPMAFVAATVFGCVVYLIGTTLPVAEIVISGSLVVLGAIVMRGQLPGTVVLAALFALAGLFHGWAYGAWIFGAEATPLSAYLVGFALVQYAIAVGSGWAVHSLWKVASSDSVKPRLVGAVVAGIGVAFLVEGVEGLIFG